MNLQWVTVAAACFRAVSAIPCSKIGWSSGNLADADTYQEGYNPFDPQGRWEVVKANDCWVRFQSYKVGETPLGARVNKLVFTATPGQVRSTINGFSNNPSNIMLWLPLMSTSFQYVRISSIFMLTDLAASKVRIEGATIEVVLGGNI